MCMKYSSPLKKFFLIRVFAICILSEKIFVFSMFVMYYPIFLQENFTVLVFMFRVWTYHC